MDNAKPQVNKSTQAVEVKQPSLTVDQFKTFLKEHRRATIYAAVLAGRVTNMPGITPTQANVKSIKDLAEAVLELMG